MKLKSLGYREEDILDIHNADGSPVPSVKTICETRTALRRAAKVLGTGERTQASYSGSNTRPTTTATTDAGAMQEGRRMDGGQGGVQSAQLASQLSVAGMVIPQRQQPPHGSIAQTVTPHQFGLTPFQSTSSYYTCPLLSL